MSTQAALFDTQEAQRLKKLGIEAAYWKRVGAVQDARNFALMIARNNAGEVDADKVYIVMDAFGRHPELLGNAWGSVFNNGTFEWTGRWVKSKRTTNHGRMNRVWRIK